MNDISYGATFPDPFLSNEEKVQEKYGLQFAKAVMAQWGDIADSSSFFKKRKKIFERNRRYGNGTQDTAIYTSLLTSQDPEANADGTFLNLDFTPVPILPKFLRIVTNKILSREPYPVVSALDPFSDTEKDIQRRKIEIQIQNRDKIIEVSEKLGMKPPLMDDLPESTEEFELLKGYSLKSNSEIAGQLSLDLTLRWNDFFDSVYRRAVNDLGRYGMGVIKRNNDPNYGLVTKYIDPSNFIHSHTEDPNFSDLIYAGHVERTSISELRRLSGGRFKEEELKKIARSSANRNKHDITGIDRVYNYGTNHVRYAYDEYMVDILYFEFKSIEKMFFERKENKYGNSGFHYKGDNYKAPENSVFNREVTCLEVETVFEGVHIIGTNYVFNYGKQSNIPKNIHDITRTNLSYSVVATNLEESIPKSMIDSCIGFADMLQLIHLKIQQAIAKAKPDGLMVDIEALENVQLGKGGELVPIELHDIYEQTGVYYYRGKTLDGGYQSRPIQEISNHIKNINELVFTYNHYLNMIRDTTGVNEVMDGTSPKGDQLVGVRQQAMEAGNNAIYDITHAAMQLFKRVSEDLLKSIQVIPRDSILYRAYENSIGKEKAALITTFRDLPMFNFGVLVDKDMDDTDKAYLEQNIQTALSAQDIDLEDAIMIRKVKDIKLAERMLIIRRKKRMRENQEIAMQNSQMQSQMQVQAAQAASEARKEEVQFESLLDIEKKKVEHQIKMQQMNFEWAARMEIAELQAASNLGVRSDDQDFREKLETLKEDRKDTRSKLQAAQQSKLISQRKGQRGELEEPVIEGEEEELDDFDLMLQNLM